MRGKDEFEQFVREKLKIKLATKQIQTTKEGLKDQLKELGVRDLKEVAEKGLDRVVGHGERWSQDHDRQYGKYVQKFMTGFARYLEAYSGVVEVLKQGGSGYGAAAYSTLSLFLIVRLPSLRSQSLG